MQSQQFQILLAIRKKVKVIRKKKKALYYANSYESQIFKKNQLKVRKVNVSVTNQLPTKSKKEKKKETKASKAITKRLSEC